MIRRVRELLQRSRDNAGALRLRMQGPPDYERIRTLEELGRAQPRVRFDSARTPVEGWLTPAEQRALYSLARWAPGPVLEIGPWLGLSTATLALGIADSRTAKPFLTREINPTPANFRAIDAGHVGLFLPPDSAEAMGICSRESFEREIAPVIARSEGVIGQLRHNLERCGVSASVTISVGDFRELESRAYGLVFCDAMHDEREIRRNAPHLRRFLAPGSILACHDTNDDNARLLRELFRFEAAFKADSLFAGEIARS